MPAKAELIMSLSDSWPSTLILHDLEPYIVMSFFSDM